MAPREEKIVDKNEERLLALEKGMGTITGLLERLVGGVQNPSQQEMEEDPAPIVTVAPDDLEESEEASIAEIVEETVAEVEESPPSPTYIENVRVTELGESVKLRLQKKDPHRDFRGYLAYLNKHLPVHEWDIEDRKHFEAAFYQYLQDQNLLDKAMGILARSEYGKNFSDLPATNFFVVLCGFLATFHAANVGSKK